MSRIKVGYKRIVIFRGKSFICNNSCVPLNLTKKKFMVICLKVNKTSVTLFQGPSVIFRFKIIFFYTKTLTNYMKMVIVWTLFLNNQKKKDDNLTKTFD